jgi:hypothetical protein
MRGGQPQHLFVEGEAGPIEVVVHDAQGRRGLALVAHPHPLFGGSLDNKVVLTMARCFRDLGYVSLRPNFRGVGDSAGAHDHGIAETSDLLRVLEHARRHYGDLPVVLGGYSFGAYVQTRVAKRLAETGRPAQRIVLVAPAAGIVTAGRKYVTESVPADSIVIHGELDETVPLANVFDWARPLELPVIVVPGADHFFHRRLHAIRDIINNAWRH